MSLSTISNPYYSPALKCLVIKDDDIYHGTKAQSRIKDAASLYDYGALSDSHQEPLSDQDNTIFIGASMDTCKLFRTSLAYCIFV